MGMRWLVLALGLGSCGGQAVDSGPAGPEVGEPGTAGSRAAASNRAQTLELRSTALPLGAALGALDAQSQGAVCDAVGAWRLRMNPKFCDAFIQSAVALTDHSDQEYRALCQEALPACPTARRTEATPACESFPVACVHALSELDRCLAEDERWYAGVPTCENMTRATAPTTIGPTPSAACQRLRADCPY